MLTWDSPLFRDVDAFVLEQNMRVRGVWHQILEKIRLGGDNLTDGELQYILRRFVVFDQALPLIRDELYTALCARKAHVHQINSASRKALPEVTWQCTTTDANNFDVKDEDLLARVDKHCSLPRVVELSVGDPVMVTRNISVASGIVNGLLGTVKEINPRCRLVTIQRRSDPTSDGDVYILVKTDHVLIPGKGYVKRRQTPLTLCWATTVHKFQGQERDCLVVVLDHMDDQTGQLYTALSRCKDGEKVVLTRMTVGSISIDEFKKLIKVDSATRAKLETLTEASRLKPLPPGSFDPFHCLVASTVSGVRSSLKPALVIPSWCKCGHCPFAEAADDQVCCETAGCITTTDGFRNCVSFTEDDIAEEHALWEPQNNTPASVESMTSAQNVLLGHRKVFRLIHGKGERSIRVTLPWCCVEQVRRTFIRNVHN